MTKTIVLIHGAWLTPASWDQFAMHYEARGMKVIAPAWPYDDRPVAVLRRRPRPELAHVTVGKILDHYTAIIEALDEPPILIGHSFGGLFVQLLLDRGLGACGVAIDPAAPKGVPPSLTALWGALPVFLAWRGWRRALTMSARQFGRAFAHTLPAAEQLALHHRLVVPTPGRIYWQAALGQETEVKFRNNDRAPLLLIAGELDRTVTPDMVEKVYRLHQASNAITDFKLYPGRPHLLIATPGWEEIADHALEWAVRYATQQNCPGRLAAVA